MGKWIRRLSRIQNPTHKQVPKVTEAPFVTFGTEDPQEYPEINHPSESRDPTHKQVPKVTEGGNASGLTGENQELHQAIRQAQSFQGLSTVLEQVQAAFQAEEIDQYTAEELAAVAAQEAQEWPDDAKERRLADLFHEWPICRVHSRILDEEVLFVADGAEVPANNTLTVYRTSELRHLVGKTPEALCRIHALKVALEGEVIKNISSGLQIPIRQV